MQITKNGFYKVADLDADIDILDGLEVFFYDDTSLKPRINLGAGTILHYISFFDQVGSYDTHIICQWEGSELILNTLIHARDSKISAKIMGEADANNTRLTMNIIALAAQHGEIQVDGVLKINQALRQVFGRLDENNIFLGSSWKLSGFPTLLVASDDIDASHGCKMEKISDEELFYLRSRGVDKNNALKMLLEAKIQVLLSGVEAVYPEQYQILKDTMLEQVLA